jgi:plasmid stability protein
MKHLEILELPDAVYEVIERRALAADRTPAAEAAEILTLGVDAELKEQALLDEIRKERDEMARRGFFLIEEDIESAIDWGRK